MILLSIASIATSMAAPGQSNDWLPGASPIVMGSGRVGPDFSVANSEVDSYAIRGVVGVQPKIALNLHLKAQREFTHLHLGGRYLILSSNKIHLGAFEQVQIRTNEFISHSGVTMEIPITHVRIDSSVSLLTLHQDHNWNVYVPPKAMRNAEIGISTNIAPRQELRFGNKIEDGKHTPLFSYRWIGSWWFLSPTLALPNLDRLELTVNTSLRF